MEETPGNEYLFPSPKSTGSKPYINNVRKGWAGTLKKAGVPYFALYELRHTFATRLSAGGVADHMATQMLRQGDAGVVFKLYSQAELREFHSRSGRFDRFYSHFFAWTRLCRRCGEGGQCCSERSYWSGRRDLNPGPLAPQASALARLRHGPKSQ
jgi:hypothetical protein